MEMLASIFFFAGMAVQVAATIWILAIAFGEDVVNGLLVLFVPCCYALYYAITRWSDCKVPVACYFVGLGLETLGMLLGRPLGSHLMG